MSGGVATEHICGVVGVTGVVGVVTRIFAESSTLPHISRDLFGTLPYRTAEKKNNIYINKLLYFLKTAHLKLTHIFIQCKQHIEARVPDSSSFAVTSSDGATQNGNWFKLENVSP